MDILIKLILPEQLLGNCKGCTIIAVLIITTTIGTLGKGLAGEVHNNGPINSGIVFITLKWMFTVALAATAVATSRLIIKAFDGTRIRASPTNYLEKIPNFQYYTL